MTPVLLLWMAAAFVAGALPFSVWVGRVALRTDIRTVGDSNPGATNVLRAGGKGAAALALLLDFFKGAIPVGLATYWAGWTGWPLALIALMPVLGHAFSPFLGFRGGKAVAVTGGIWCGLTGWEGPTVGGLLLGLGVYLFGANGWAVMTAMVGMLAYFLLAPASWSLPGRPDVATLTLIWTGNMAVLIWKHRADLAAPPHLRRRGVKST